ncbi:hypothetical protein [Mycobacteroides abscessus]|uniref:hypothetical protein n=1 Tax=Mycobacteroides abscessus TaxID=36809 RepID=UPI0009294F11|nr:hypothetical protein [Mycobacteroides abscessus]SHW54331.1 Uncharacterised protein [Mycobacteroides abscessus subsp. abscessus]SIA41235.1 Uncharacterised protein [Mycobacteroides abscessus subsp. abscessus]SKR77464.1 Uncharacterised protein [Mycobacteroides abscessus subsp. abscessus]
MARIVGHFSLDNVKPEYIDQLRRFEAEGDMTAMREFLDNFCHWDYSLAVEWD